MLTPLLMMICLVLADPPQKVEVTRFSDRVVILDRQRGEEAVKFHNNKFALLQEGDDVRQGSSAISECRFEDDGRVRFFSSARYGFGELSLERHVVVVESFTRIWVKARENVTFLLPGGTRLEVVNGDCYLEREVNLIHIRNAGHSEVKLSGHLVDPEHETVPAGNTVTVRLYGRELEAESEPIEVREVSGMIVKTTGGYRFEERPGFLLVSRIGAEDGTACVGGARIYLKPEESVQLRLH